MKVVFIWKQFPQYWGLQSWKPFAFIIRTGHQSEPAGDFQPDKWFAQTFHLRLSSTLVTHFLLFPSFMKSLEQFWVIARRYCHRYTWKTTAVVFTLESLAPRHGKRDTFRLVFLVSRWFWLLYDANFQRDTVWLQDGNHLGSEPPNIDKNSTLSSFQDAHRPASCCDVSFPADQNITAKSHKLSFIRGIAAKIWLWGLACWKTTKNSGPRFSTLMFCYV